MSGRGEALRSLVVGHTSGLWGAERVILELGPRVAARGVDIRLACPPDGPLPDAWRAAGLQHVPLEVPRHRGIRTPEGGRSAPWLAREAAVVASTTWRLARLARDVDIVHSNHQWSHVEVAMAAKLARRRAVLHVHDLLPPGIGRRMLVAAARRSDATLVACQAIGERLGDGAAARLEVLYPALDLDEYRPGPADPDVRAALGGVPGEPLVGIVGRLDPVKGIDILMRAMAALEGEARRTRLAVVGGTYGAPPGYVAELQQLGEQLLGDRIRFVGLRDDVPEVLRALDVLVNASRLEPFGTIVLEAQACGRAVIATTAGGVGEHVEDGEEGLMVPAEDVPALTAALQRLLDDPDEREAMGRTARRMVEERFDIEQAADQLVEVYRRVASR